MQFISLTTTKNINGLYNREHMTNIRKGLNGGTRFKIKGASPYVDVRQSIGLLESNFFSVGAMSVSLKVVADGANNFISLRNISISVSDIVRAWSEAGSMTVVEVVDFNRRSLLRCTDTLAEIKAMLIGGVEKECVLNFISNDDGIGSFLPVFNFQFLKNTYVGNISFLETETPGVYTLYSTDGEFLEKFTVPGDTIVESFYPNGDKITAQWKDVNTIEIKTYLADDLETPALGVANNTFIAVRTFNPAAL